MSIWTLNVSEPSLSSELTFILRAIPFSGASIREPEAEVLPVVLPASSYPTDCATWIVPISATGSTVNVK